MPDADAARGRRPRCRRGASGLSGIAALAALGERVRAADPHRRFGTLTRVQGACLSIAGLGGAARIGARLHLAGSDGPLAAEVTALDSETATAMAFAPTESLVTGTPAELVA